MVPAPSWQNPSNVSQSVCEFTLTEFSKRKQLKNRFFSPFFYTHQNGYKMCLIVCANGSNTGNGTHVSIYVQLLAGDNDDQLQWPFVGDIILELVNWRKDKGHHSKTLSISVVCGLDKVTEGTVGMSFGLSQFVSHSCLSYNRSTKTEYLLNDSLHLRVMQIAVYSTPFLLKIPPWQNPCKVTQSVCEFTLTDFLKRKEFSNKCYGPSFYTHPQGYKMCFEAFANGDKSGKDTHVSVYVRLVAGDNDDQLQWPFVGDIELLLLNWQEDKGHFKKTFSINATSGLVRILEGMMGNGLGYHQFISHSSLSYNPATNTEYLRNDSLRLRVEQVAVYSTPLPLVIPCWQNPRNVSQSVCEFTLNEFSKRKQLNNTFYGPSFYTNQHGYKMCLKVYANGSDDGKDTHVSVYVNIMAGDNDEQLQWPFVGDIEFMLLNWRENKGHHKARGVE